MQTLALNASALAAAPARPAVAQPPAREVWDNGVVHTRVDATDVYELPAARDGVAQKIELTPRLWGLLGKKVKVTDAQGHVLQAHRAWEGFHRIVVARDPQTGIETSFDPKKQTMEASTLRQVVSHEVQSNWMKTVYTQEARQQVGAGGATRFVTDLQGTQEVVFTSMVREMPANTPWVVRDDRSFEETLLPKGAQPATRKIEADHYSRKDVADLASSVDAGGLSITGPDGTTHVHEFLLTPQ